jgi:hypothetical protein
MAAQYWSSASQVHTIFHWKDLLEIWNTNYVTSYPIETVLVNLDRVRQVNLSCFQFKQYLNFMEEEEGMKWFLYECIMRKHTWPSLEFGVFIRNLTDDIALDTGFPIFPGSPRNITVRAFLENHLSPPEIDFLDLMPGLIPVPTYSNGFTGSRASFASPTSSASSASTSASASPAPPTSHNHLQARQKNASCQIRIIRSLDGQDKEDDIIYLSKNGDLFNFSYVDPTTINGNPTRMIVKGLNSNEVLTRLSYTFRLMALDSLPFEAVQLLVPGYPCVVLPVKELDSYTRDLIYDTVDDTMKNWPIVNVA